MRVLLMLGGLAAGLVGLGIDAWEIFPSVMTATPANPLPRSLPDAFVYFWTYFTHLTNLGLLAIYVAELTGWQWLGWGRTAAARAIGASYIVLVGLFYHVMLAPTLQMEGALAIATWLLHYATPAVFLLWWLASPHGELRYRRIPLLVPGLTYVGYVLGRGAMVGEYPYDILDAGKFGYVQVAIGTGTLIAAVALFCALLVGVDAWLARQPSPRSGA